MANAEGMASTEGVLPVGCGHAENHSYDSGGGLFSTENLMAGPTASTQNDPRLSLRLTDASPLGNVSA